MKPRKIDIFERTLGSNRYEYAATTERSKTCKEAKERYCTCYNKPKEIVKTSFRK